GRTTTALEQALAEAGRTVQSVRNELDAARRSLTTGGAAAAARESGLAAEIERLRARLTEAEIAATRESELVRVRERQQERLTLDLRAAEAREQQLREELSATAERTLSDSQEELRQALASTRTAEEA